MLIDALATRRLVIPWQHQDTIESKQDVRYVSFEFAMG